MSTARQVGAFVRQHSRGIGALSLLTALYIGSYWYRVELGLAHPMANMAYYYYGSYPNKAPDLILYWLYSPASVFGDSIGIHWKARSDAYDPSAF